MARKPKPSPDSYSRNAYEAFLRRMDDNGSDLAEIQADRRELLKAETQRGLNRKAHAFVSSLRAAVRNDKMTEQDAVATLDCVQVYAEWCGLTAQRDLFRPENAEEAQQEQAAAEAPNGSGNGTAKPKRSRAKRSDQPWSDGAFKVAGSDEGEPRRPII